MENLTENNENIDNLTLDNTENNSVEPNEDNSNKKGKGSILGFVIYCLVLVLILVGVYLVNTFVFMRVQVNGQSMENTLNSGDYLIANRVKKANYGDIIIIDGEKNNGDLLIKRLIARGGDTVKIVDGAVYLKKAGQEEFVKLEEDYVKKQGVTKYRNSFAEKIFEVPLDCVFYLGDNRDNSADSRIDYKTDGEFGFAKEDQIVSVVENWSLSLRGVNAVLGKIFRWKTTGDE